MSESESDYYQTVSSNEQNKKNSTQKPSADNTKKRKPRSSSKNSTPPSKKSNTGSDIFGVSQNRGAASTHTENDNPPQPLLSYFVNRVGNGCERRTATLDGEYYVDCKVYKADDAITVKSMELWKKALVRIKFPTNAESPQWRTLQKFVLSADSLFPDPPRFYDK